MAPVRAGIPCPRCQGGQMLLTAAGDWPSCLSCGHVPTPQQLRDAGYEMPKDKHYDLSPEERQALREARR